MSSALRRGIIVSCQALKDEPMYGSEIMARMAIAAQEGGAVGIRANTPEDIAEIKKHVSLPVIGIFKDEIPGFDVYITPTIEHANKVFKAGADLIALDCTKRPHPQSLESIFQHIKSELRVPIVADVADLEDALEIAKLRPDFISTTLSGYTDCSKNHPIPDIDLVREIHERIPSIPVIAEGNYVSPDQVVDAMIAGAYAVVVGGAITRPQQTTKRFVNAVKFLSNGNGKAIGVDLGGTHTRGGIVNSTGEILDSTEILTDIDAPMKSIESVIEKLFVYDISRIGVGSAGRIDFENGKVIYATDNLHNWTGTKIKSYLESKYKLPVIVDNDVNAATYGHWFSMKGKVKNFAYIAVGTGLGSGLVLDGKLRRGPFGNAGEIGHIVVPGNERICTCGKTGCAETVLSGRYIREEYEKRFGKFSRDDFLILLEKRDKWAKNIVDEMAKYAAWLVDLLVNTIDVEKVYFGGIVEDFGDEFLNRVKDNLDLYTKANDLYDERIVEISPMKKMGTVVGVALESIYLSGGALIENESTARQN
ncbi:putative N-acetylmannosamine-6-phosphate 2-epimerase [Athalassotoga sp.]|uniref:putative N-acetylmannosamine-6-phosphate 2-epimerase n=1 Tax=Athalassotoga sp. TaxID=2022597 RepID=UPI003D0276A3